MTETEKSDMKCVKNHLNAAMLKIGRLEGEVDALTRSYESLLNALIKMVEYRG